MNRHIITVLCLVAAIALYALGLVMPASALILLGALAEITFWARLFRIGKRNSD